MSVQLPLSLGDAQLPLDPAELAQLSAPERGLLYRQLGLCVLQRAAAEEAVRAVLAGQYRRGEHLSAQTEGRPGNVRRGEVMPRKEAT